MFLSTRVPRAPLEPAWEINDKGWKDSGPRRIKEAGACLACQAQRCFFLLVCKTEMWTEVGWFGKEATITCNLRWQLQSHNSVRSTHSHVQHAFKANTDHSLSSL